MLVLLFAQFLFALCVCFFLLIFGFILVLVVCLFLFCFLNFSSTSMENFSFREILESNSDDVIFNVYETLEKLISL